MPYFTRERVYDMKTGNEVGYIETEVPAHRVRLDSGASEAERIALAVAKAVVEVQRRGGLV